MAPMLTRGAHVFVLAVAFAALGAHTACAAPARLWLSESNLDPAPEAPTLTAVVGTPRLLQIWARPATDAVGAYRSLRNFSLDVRSQQPIVDLLDLNSTPAGAITVYNPATAGSAGRFEFVNDSSAAGLPLTSQVNGGGANDAILGLAGFTITSTSHLGLGTTCDSADWYCGSDGTADAWLLASFAYQALSSGTAHLVLQIGQNGISHDGESSLATDVLFGTGSTIYNADLHRQVTLAGDLTVEATIHAVATSTPTTWSGAGGDWATATWSAGVPTGAHDAVVAAAGGETLTLTGRQAANDTQVSSGQLHVDAGGSLASRVSVHSGGRVSGGGWIVGDLDHSHGGTHSIESIETLRVAGSADVTGAHIALASGYSQPAGTITMPWDLLHAAEVVGTYVETAGSYLGRAIFLSSISYSSDAVSIQLRHLPGDYNGDGSVDNADYFVWAADYGAAGIRPADGSLDGVVGGGDYVVWRNSVGNTATLLGSGSIQAVPEPGGAWLCVLGGLTLQCGVLRAAAKRQDRPPASNSCG